MELLQNRERHQMNGDSGVFSGSDELGDSNAATIISGPYMAMLPVAGMTVSQIRERLATRLDIPSRSIAVIDGQDVSEDAVLKASQCLVFVSRAGEKGVIWASNLFC